MNNKPSTCKNCTSSNFRQIGELSYTEWLRQMNNQGWRNRNGLMWYNTRNHETMKQDEAMEWFRAGETPYPPAWDEVDSGRLLVWSRCVPGKWIKGTAGTATGNTVVNVGAGITGVLKDE